MCVWSDVGHFPHLEAHKGSLEMTKEYLTSKRRKKYFESERDSTAIEFFFSTVLREKKFVRQSDFRNGRARENYTTIRVVSRNLSLLINRLSPFTSAAYLRVRISNASRASDYGAVNSLAVAGESVARSEFEVRRRWRDIEESNLDRSQRGRDHFAKARHDHEITGRRARVSESGLLLSP